MMKGNFTMKIADRLLIISPWNPKANIFLKRTDVAIYPGAVNVAAL